MSKILHRVLLTMLNSYKVLVCALCYSGAAVLGYLTFGSLVREDVLMSYPGNRVEVQLAIAAMALKTYSTYPILLFCGREALRNLLQDCSGWDLAVEPNAFRFTSVAVTIWESDCYFFIVNRLFNSVQELVVAQIFKVIVSLVWQKCKSDHYFRLFQLN